MKKLILFCLFSNIYFSFAQWTPQNSGTSNFLHQIFFLNKDTGYVVQDNGVLRRTTDGGTNWNLIYSGTPLLIDISFTTYMTGHAAGDHNIVKTIDGGLSWTVQYSNANFYFWKIFFPTSNIGFVTAQNASNDSIYIIKTIDSGNSWNIVHSDFDMTVTGNYYSLYFVNQDTGFVVIEYTPIVGKTFDGGLNWQYDTMQTAFEALECVNFSSGGTGYVAGTGGIIFKTVNYGNSWTTISDPGNTLPLYGVWFTNPNIGYVVGGDGFSSGVILRTTNGGASWTNTPGLSQTPNSIYFPTSSIGYTCGTNGAILKYDAAIGINENENLISSLIVYPNPTNGSFILKMEKEGIINISVYNILGREIFYKEKITEQSTVIDLSSNPKGIYFIKVIQAGKTAVRKIVLM